MDNATLKLEHNQGQELRPQLRAMGDNAQVQAQDQKLAEVWNYITLVNSE